MPLVFTAYHMVQCKVLFQAIAMIATSHLHYQQGAAANKEQELSVAYSRQ